MDRRLAAFKTGLISSLETNSQGGPNGAFIAVSMYINYDEKYHFFLRWQSD
jgi:hypothetical protein